jgi:hypothetical protein
MPVSALLTASIKNLIVSNSMKANCFFIFDIVIHPKAADMPPGYPQLASLLSKIDSRRRMNRFRPSNSR